MNLRKFLVLLDCWSQNDLFASVGHDWLESYHKRHQKNTTMRSQGVESSEFSRYHVDTMTTYTNPKTGATIESKLTHQEAVEAVRQKAKAGYDFAMSLVENFDKHGSLSLAQLYWVHKLASEKPQQALDLDVPYQNSKPLPAPRKFVDEVGVYIVDGVVYKVLPCRESDRKYAKRLTESGQWVYEKGAMGLLKPEHKATLEQAKEYGRITGYCAVCGRLLTDEKSISIGMGKICYNRLTNGTLPG